MMIRTYARNIENELKVLPNEQIEKLQMLLFNILEHIHIDLMNSNDFSNVRFLQGYGRAIEDLIFILTNIKKEV